MQVCPRRFCWTWLQLAETHCKLYNSIFASFSRVLSLMGLLTIVCSPCEPRAGIRTPDCCALFRRHASPQDALLYTWHSWARHWWDHSWSWPRRRHRWGRHQTPGPAHPGSTLHTGKQNITLVPFPFNRWGSVFPWIKTKKHGKEKVKVNTVPYMIVVLLEHRLSFILDSIYSNTIPTHSKKVELYLRSRKITVHDGKRSYFGFCAAFMLASQLTWIAI